MNKDNQENEEDSLWSQGSFVETIDFLNWLIIHFLFFSVNFSIISPKRRKKQNF